MKKRFLIISLIFSFIFPSVVLGVPDWEYFSTEYYFGDYYSNKDVYLRADMSDPNIKWDRFEFRGNVGLNYTITGYSEIGTVLLTQQGTLGSNKDTVILDAEVPQIKLTGDEGIKVSYAIKGGLNLVVLQDEIGEFYDYVDDPPPPTSEPELAYQLVYQPTRDSYRLDWENTPAGTSQLFLQYTSDSGNVSTKSWDYSGTDILYLTCNGRYDVFFKDSSSSSLAKITNLQTTEMVNPSCSSYPPSYMDDLGLTSDGTNLNWNAETGATNYDIYKDGVLVGSTAETTFPISVGGAYTVSATDSSGTILGQSDIYVTGGSSSCSVCDCIESLKPTLERIDYNTGGALSKLDNVISGNEQINQSVQSLKPVIQEISDKLTVTNNKLTEVKDSIDSFHNELQTDSPYYVPNASDYNMTHEENKPVTQETYFEDNTIYFSDQGDSLDEAATFIKPPEPTDNWNGIFRETPMSSDVPLEKDITLIKDDTLIRDDVPEKDSVLIRDDVPEKQNTTYPLRWKSP